MGKSNSQKARDVNVANFGCKEENNGLSANFASYTKKLLPKKHTDFRRVLAHLNLQEAEKLFALGEEIPKGVSVPHLQVFSKLLEIGKRPPVQNVERVRCTKCKTEHEVVCPKCGPHEIELQNAQFEKNSITCLTKLADKFAPNIAAITHDINVNIVVHNLSKFLVDSIARYVPAQDRSRVLNEFTAVLNNIEEAEYEDV